MNYAIIGLLSAILIAVCWRGILTFARLALLIIGHICIALSGAPMPKPITKEENNLAREVKSVEGPSDQDNMWRVFRWQLNGLTPSQIAESVFKKSRNCNEGFEDVVWNDK